MHTGVKGASGTGSLTCRETVPSLPLGCSPSHTALSRPAILPAKAREKGRGVGRPSGNPQPQQLTTLPVPAALTPICVIQWVVPNVVHEVTGRGWPQQCWGSIWTPWPQKGLFQPLGDTQGLIQLHRQPREAVLHRLNCHEPEHFRASLREFREIKRQLHHYSALFWQWSTNIISP